MASASPFSFEGYEELIRKPLERSDPRSFLCIRTLLETFPAPPGSCPFAFLIKALSAAVISQREARHHWKKIIEHKRRLELKLSRPVAIRVACIDYYDLMGVDPPPVSMAQDGAPPAQGRTPPRTATAAPSSSGTAMQALSPDGRLPERKTLYQERLRVEMMRARRYKHALSVIMTDVDLRTVPPEIAEKAAAVIMKLINKAVRTVDILARHADGCFLVMLPNTNKREALELAERLKNNISQRTSRIPELTSAAIRVTIALGQCSKEDTAAEFIKRLERLLESARSTNSASISILD